MKEDFVRNDIKQKILGTVDTSYTGEHGLEETIVKGEHLIKEAHIFKEKKLLERFFTELQKSSGLSLYKLDEVLKALDMGAVELLIIIEDIELKIEGKAVFEECFKNGLIINCTQGNVLRIMPALNVTKKQIKKALYIFEKSLAAANKR